MLDILLNGVNGINNFNSFYSMTPKLSTGYFFSSQGMLELTRNGCTPKAYDLLTDLDFHSWLYPTTVGFTTCWEGWTTWVENAGYYPQQHLRSFNHLPFGAVSEWIWKVIGGINPDDAEPGFKNTIIKPEPGGGMTEASASLNSLHGLISSGWVTNAVLATYTLTVTVPANTSATVLIPSTNTLRIAESDGPCTSAPGVASYWFTNAPNFTNATAFHIGSGTYRFSLSSD